MHFLQEKRMRKKLRIMVISTRNEDEEEPENCTFYKKSE